MKQPSKQEALDAIAELERWTSGRGNEIKILNDFIESVDSVDTDSIKRAVEDAVGSDGYKEAALHGGMIDFLLRVLTDNIPDAINTLRSDYTEKDAEIEQLNDLLTRQQASWEIENSELKEFVNRDSNTIDRLRAKIAELEKNNYALEERYDSLQEDFQNRETELLDKISEIEKQNEDEISNLSYGIKQISSKNRRVQRMYVDTSNNKKMLETKYELLKNSSKEKDTKIADLEKTVEDLMKQIPPRYAPEREYTEDELRSVLNEEIEVFERNGFRTKIAPFTYGALYLELSVDENGKKFGHMNGKFRPFKKLLKPPNNCTPVVVKNSCGVYWPFLSRGKFDEFSNLEVENNDGVSYYKEWCCMDNPLHHSPGWNPEWNPEKETRGTR